MPASFPLDPALPAEPPVPALPALPAPPVVDPAEPPAPPVVDPAEPPVDDPAEPPAPPAVDPPDPPEPPVVDPPDPVVVEPPVPTDAPADPPVAPPPEPVLPPRPAEPPAPPLSSSPEHAKTRSDSANNECLCTLHHPCSRPITPRRRAPDHAGVEHVLFRVEHVPQDGSMVAPSKMVPSTVRGQRQYSIPKERRSACAQGGLRTSMCLLLIRRDYRRIPIRFFTCCFIARSLPWRCRSARASGLVARDDDALEPMVYRRDERRRDHSLPALTGLPTVSSRRQTHSLVTAQSATRSDLSCIIGWRLRLSARSTSGDSRPSREAIRKKTLLQ
jgi:hypothetical protein